MDYETAQTIFGQIAGGTFIGLDSLTEVPLLGGKANPHKGRVQKRMLNATAMVFGNNNSNAYENMVKRRLVQEGTDPKQFELSPRKWGERIKGTAFVHHKGEYYIEMIFIKAGQIEYLLDGSPVNISTIEGMPAEREPTGQGGLQNQVQIRTFKLTSIIEVRANNDVYR